jgi:hypothetical protein
MKTLTKIMFLAIAALLIWSACNHTKPPATTRHYPGINTKGHQQ